VLGLGGAYSDYLWDFAFGNLKWSIFIYDEVQMISEVRLGWMTDYDLMNGVA